MNVYDPAGMTVQSSEGSGTSVLQEGKNFKMRVVELEPGGYIPQCEMSSHVIFYVLNGATEVKVDSGTAMLKAGQCMVTGPATLSMSSESGVRLLGIQIAQAETD
ncbi:MAG: hypothetical protein ACOC7M_03520 [Chloroflexota bacterium]